MSAAERAFLYDYSKNVVVPCLLSAGYGVPPLPDRGRYIGQEAQWWAYEYAQQGPNDAEVFGEVRLDNLRLRCPEHPDGWHNR